MREKEKLSQEREGAKIVHEIVRVSETGDRPVRPNVSCERARSRRNCRKERSRRAYARARARARLN